MATLRPGQTTSDRQAVLSEILTVDQDEFFVEQLDELFRTPRPRSPEASRPKPRARPDPEGEQTQT